MEILDLKLQLQVACKVKFRISKVDLRKDEAETKQGDYIRAHRDIIAMSELLPLEKSCPSVHH